MKKFVMIAAVLAGVTGAFAFKSPKAMFAPYGVDNVIAWPAGSSTSTTVSSITFRPADATGEFGCDQLVERVCKVSPQQGSVTTNNPDGTITITNALITKGEYLD